MLRFIFCLLCLLYSGSGFARNHILIAHIAHGSRPHPDHRDTQKHWLGGMLGGHVVLELDSFAYGFNFNSSRVHIFPRRNDSRQAGVFEKEPANDLLERWENNKLTSVFIPLNDSDYVHLKNELEELHRNAEFDYAFWGMRCASTAYMLLSYVGVFESAGKFESIRKAFHPRAFRKKLIRAAQQKQLQIKVQKGSTERIWEGDRKKGK